VAIEYRINLAGAVVLEGRPVDREDCYLLQRVSGLGEGRDRREQVEPLVGTDGDYLGPASRGGLTLTIEGVIVAPSRAALRAKRAALLAALEPADASAEFEVTVLDRVGDPEQGLAALMRASLPLAGPDTAEDGMWTAPFQFGLRSASPAWAGAAYAVEIAPGFETAGRVYPKVYPMVYASGVAAPVVLANAGNATAWPLLRIHGRSVAPIIEDTIRGIRLAFPAYTVPEGATLEIDPEARTVLAGGEFSVYGERSLDSTWFGIPPGGTALRFVDTDHSASARLEVIYTDAIY
jgi:hypothetical protein